MGFLQRNVKSVVRDDVPFNTGSQQASSVQLDRHLSVARYGSFLLTDAVRPSFDVKVVPSAGWRKDNYRDNETKIDVPVIMAAQTSESLFDLFLDLLAPFGDEVDVVLETSHDSESGSHQDLYRESIDMPILKSMLFDYENLLTHDGCTGIAVLNPQIPMEVQFDEHKLLTMYGHDLEPFEQILRAHNLSESRSLRFITEAEHIHSSTEEFTEEFRSFRYRLGVDSLDGDTSPC